MFNLLFYNFEFYYRYWLGGTKAAAQEPLRGAQAAGESLGGTEAAREPLGGAEAAGEPLGGAEDAREPLQLLDNGDKL